MPGPNANLLEIATREGKFMSAVWEYREMRFTRGAKRSEIKSLLTSLAEIERWELDRVRIANDGRRTVRLRRKTYLIQRTA